MRDLNQQGWKEHEWMTGHIKNKITKKYPYIH